MVVVALLGNLGRKVDGGEGIAELLRLRALVHADALHGIDRQQVQQRVAPHPHVERHAVDVGLDLAAGAAGTHTADVHGATLGAAERTDRVEARYDHARGAAQGGGQVKGVEVANLLLADHGGQAAEAVNVVLVDDRSADHRGFGQLHAVGLGQCGTTGKGKCGGAAKRLVLHALGVPVAISRGGPAPRAWRHPQVHRARGVGRVRGNGSGQGRRGAGVGCGPQATGPGCRGSGQAVIERSVCERQVWQQGRERQARVAAQWTIERGIGGQVLA
ncbi:hypothetical protein D3C81_1013800 [compost metagenome]